MSITRRVVAALAAATAAGALVAPAAATAADARHRVSLQPQVDAITDAGATAALAEFRTSGSRWSGASGVRDLVTSRPAQPNGRFRIGSVTKTFVSTVMLQLSAEGSVDLDAPIERYLPGLIPGGQNITVRQLLNHTSGIYSYTDALIPATPEGFLRIRFNRYTPRGLVAIAAAHPPYFPPGTGWHYSNTNYVLAGLIIERVTGRPYGEAVTRRVIRPLGLHDTSVPGTRTAIAGPHAHGYLLVGTEPDQRPVDTSELNPAIAFSAGEMISSTKDLNTFFAALLRGRLLPPAQLAQMKTTINLGPGSGYGLGIERDELPCGVTLWGHGGGIPGYATITEHTADGGTQLSSSLNPLRDDDAVLGAAGAMIGTAFCGSPAAAPRGLRVG
jgi:D-alanyl-D-alanine carboxypeptidase